MSVKFLFKVQGQSEALIEEAELQKAGGARKVIESRLKEFGIMNAQVEIVDVVRELSEKEQIEQAKKPPTGRVSQVDDDAQLKHADFQHPWLQEQMDKLQQQLDKENAEKYGDGKPPEPQYESVEQRALLHDLTTVKEEFEKWTGRRFRYWDEVLRGDLSFMDAWTTNRQFIREFYEDEKLAEGEVDEKQILLQNMFDLENKYGTTGWDITVQYTLGG